MVASGELKTVATYFQWIVQSGLSFVCLFVSLFSKKSRVPKPKVKLWKEIPAGQSQKTLETTWYLPASCLFCAANESSININVIRVEETASSITLCPVYEVQGKGNLLGQELKTKLFHVDKQFGKLMDSVSLVMIVFFICLNRTGWDKFISQV